MGLDDDGDAGSAWFIPGKDEAGTLSFDTGSACECFDINPAPIGADQPGGTASVFNYDADKDNCMDIILGFRYQTINNPPTKTIIFPGNGDATFDEPFLMREFLASDLGLYFAVPQE